MRKIWLLGDTHGDLPWVKQVQQRAKDDGADCIFQLGDFGVWNGKAGENFLKGVSSQAKRLDLPFYFLDGNHEDFMLLNKLERHKEPNEDGMFEIRPYIFHSPRGNRFEWEGVKFITMGGAVSIDKAYRKWGSSWWPEEEITDEQVDRVEEGKVEVLLSHDCPFNPLNPYDRVPKYDEMSRPNQDRLRQVYDKVNPDWLFHGHFHIGYNKIWRGTQVIGLACQWMAWSEAILEIPSMDVTIV